MVMAVRMGDSIIFGLLGLLRRGTGRAPSAWTRLHRVSTAPGAGGGLMGAQEILAASQGTLGAFIMRRDAEGVPKGAAGFIDIAQLKVADAQSLQRTVMVGVELERAATVGDGLVELAGLPQHGPAAVPAFGELRIPAGHAVEYPQSFLEIFTLRGAARFLHHAICLVAGGGKPQVFQPTLGHVMHLGFGLLQAIEQLAFSADERQDGGGAQPLVFIATQQLLIDMILVPFGPSPEMHRQETDAGGHRQDIEPARDGFQSVVHAGSLRGAALGL